MLKPLLKAIPGSDRYYFDAGYHRSTLLAMIDGDGKMIPPLTPSDAAQNLGHSDAFFHLTAIGNTLKDASPKELMSLVHLLQAPVDELIQTEGPCSDWLDKPWFKTLLLASENQGKGYKGADLLSVDDVKKGIPSVPTDEVVQEIINEVKLHMYCDQWATCCVCDQRAPSMALPVPSH
jgi:hypothetical protein